MRLILASGSKVRQEIFDMIGWKYEVITSNVDETCNLSDPSEYVIELSKRKADAVASQIPNDALIISADSIIYMDGTKFEKPKSKQEAYDNIKMMSGKMTYALTGVTIKDLYRNQEISFADITKVEFNEVIDDDIKWYVENQECLLERAGYSLEGKTALFVKEIEGDYYNVLGMPVSKLYENLNKMGYTMKNFEMK